jgi:Cu+-exporting ATPase
MTPSGSCCGTPPAESVAEGLPVSKDPVCGMTVKPESPHVLVMDGVTWRFCCAGCLQKFPAA